MNNYEWLKPRKRRRNLFIVEGKHEKNELMGLLLKIYPEIDIELEDIIIYTTNIYQLYELIKKKYDENWFDTDIDLPFIVGEKLNLNETLHKENFMNILLIFDYERHDPSFSEEKIRNLQMYFQDSTDVGKLYINYPMVESYQHLLTAQFHMKNLIDRSRYVSFGKTYYEYMRYVFNEIITHNIRKGNLILGREYQIPVQRLRECYENISLLDILQKQNIESRDFENGIIWIMNTSVLFVSDYRFELIES